MPDALLVQRVAGARVDGFVSRVTVRVAVCTRDRCVGLAVAVVAVFEKKECHVIPRDELALGVPISEARRYFR